MSQVTKLRWLDAATIFSLLLICILTPIAMVLSSVSFSAPHPATGALTPYTGVEWFQQYLFFHPYVYAALAVALTLVTFKWSVHEEKQSTPNEVAAAKLWYRRDRAFVLLGVGVLAALGYAAWHI